jgi:DNA (cytosine-5)-methyltransferase 1
MTAKKPKAPKFTFIDLFSGIGGFRIALEELGGKSVGFSDIYTPAVKVYKHNFDVSDELEIGDITSNHNLPYADILTGGVPCQSWSIAGRNKGFEDPRGRLWLDTIKVTEAVKPKAFIYENVKGLADPRNKDNLELIISEFREIGYTVHFKVLNAFDYGLPQSRERIFIVGIRNDLDAMSFSYPEPYKKLPNLSSILEDVMVLHEEKESRAEYKNSFNMAAVANKGNFFIFSDVRNGDFTIHSWDLIETTALEKEICVKILQNRRRPKYGPKDGNPMSLNDIQELFTPNVLPLTGTPSAVTKKDLDDLVEKKILRNKDGKYELVNSRISSGINGVYRIFLPESHVFSTLTRSGTRDYVATESIPEAVKDKKAYFLENIYKKNKYRTITVREAARIQGFSDDYKFDTSFSTSMALLGNSIAINIVREVSKKLLEVIK